SPCQKCTSGCKCATKEECSKTCTKPCSCCPK
nr:Chain A, CD6 METALLOTHIONEIN-1 [Callinectes sapidus]1DMD_A Chain A, CD6 METALLOTHIONEIN-1 [Callinectes sapidus]